MTDAATRDARGGRRLLVVADSDSYVKWGAALASTLPSGWRTRLVVIASPVQPSPRQLADALAGTAFTTDAAHLRHLDDLDAELDAFDPHAVLLSLRGPFVRVVAPRLNARPNRPVLLSGFPGLTIPAVPKAVVYREQTDLVVLHSRREVRDFEANAWALGVDRMFGLATLPFLATDDREAPGRERTDLVFAAQAKVPAERADRVKLLAALAELARRRPEHRVVVKVRARAGEAQTHAEEHDYADLLADLDRVPANLVVADGPMAAHLARAAALVTVSSTAALEAIALDLPVLLVDDFGVSPAMINTVFEGAGVFGSTTDLVAGRFRYADAAWLADNYFHEPQESDWARRLTALVEAREIVPLPPLERRHDLWGGALRAAFERRRMLGAFDRSLAGTLAWGIGVPVRAVVRRVRRARRALRRWTATDAARAATAVAPVHGSAAASAATPTAPPSRDETVGAGSRD
ncbi:hypothetical protein AVP42_00536 [Agromyces sp. NDB4Y10]|uniref:DUF6716 putative glycosyltransferase n=1 Tax=Agromyces sp. NDB4Y10 TaxID=1775951 RepID=UPI0007B1E46E|nr:DUF6716 putative glycosyltransferase [Agromyces sp. NDB4Y10]KZE95072.1 hypothetical protein AVP42_00536 [Agromyces sp. NDB4Y10]